MIRAGHGPTRLKRELASKVAVGGLEQSSATVAGSGLLFLPGWLRSQSSDESWIALVQVPCQAGYGRRSIS